MIGVGQIKSITNKRELVSALNILQTVKRKRIEMQYAGVIKKIGGNEFQPELNPYDQIFTFIICESIADFAKFTSEEIDRIYSGKSTSSKHNAILSINDCLFRYNAQENNVAISFPFLPGKKMIAMTTTKSEEDNILHILGLINDLYIAMTVPLYFN